MDVKDDGQADAVQLHDGPINSCNGVRLQRATLWIRNDPFRVDAETNVIEPKILDRLKILLVYEVVEARGGKVPGLGVPHA